MCVTNFTCILLENQVHSAVCVLVFSKSVFKNYLSAVYFWLYEEFGERYAKKPVSVTKKDICAYIYQSIYNRL